MTQIWKALVFESTTLTRNQESVRSNCNYTHSQLHIDSLHQFKNIEHLSNFHFDKQTE